MFKKSISTQVKIFLIGITASCFADVKPNALFTDRMVLQRNQKVLVYGAAEEGEKVTVKFNGQRVSTKCTGGDWCVELKPMKHGGPYKMTIEGSNLVTFGDVMIGDVWVLGGQSNMARTMRTYNWLMGKLPELEENENIRLFKVKESTAVDAPTKELPIASEFENSWQHCTRELLPQFSPLGYFFAVERYKRNGVPLGLVYACRGATRAESWVPTSVLESKPEYAHILDQKKNNNYRPDKKTGAPNVLRPTALYNGMVYPVMPYTIKGVLWNQGESDSFQFETYRTLFPELIRTWRREWNQGDFPFVFGQISSYQDRPNRLSRFDGEGMETVWGWQRDAQAYGLKEPNTAMVAAYDIGEWLDIHPQDKETLGKRYERAVAELDGEEVIAKGPTYKSHRIAGNRIVVSFDHVDGGLKTQRVAMNKNKGLAPGTDPEALVASADVLKGFIICGADKVFHHADAVIKGNEVVVSCAEVPNPVAVRYAWTTFALANLYNKEGLPAYTFRTDSFPPPNKVE